MKEKDHKITIQRKLAKYALSFKYAFRVTKPLLIYRTAYNYFYYIFTGKPKLRYVDLAVTYKCNLDCVHCSAARLNDTEKKDMTIEDYRKIGKELIKNGVLVIQLTGGEPMLRDDLEEVIKALNPKKLFISLGTNTLLASKERLISLKKAGLDNVCISIDDWDAKEHDRWRKRDGTHEKALTTLDQALEVGLRVMVFTVVTHQNVRSETLQKLIEFTKEKKILLLLGWAVPAGNWNANSEILLTDDDLEYLESIHEKHLHVRTDFESNYFHWGCGAGKEKLYITSFGDVIPCAFVHIKFGNIFETPMKDIRDNAMKLDWFKNYNPACLAANDKEFRASHMKKIFESEKEPISMREAGFDVDTL